MLVGQHRYIERWRRTLALRGCFFAQWRAQWPAQRNGALHGQAPRTRGQVEEALDKRLKAAILKDWLDICYAGNAMLRRSWRIQSKEQNVGITPAIMEELAPPMFEVCGAVRKYAG